MLEKHHCYYILFVSEVNKKALAYSRLQEARACQKVICHMLYINQLAFNENRGHYFFYRGKPYTIQHFL